VAHKDYKKLAKLENMVQNSCDVVRVTDNDSHSGSVSIATFCLLFRQCKLAKLLHQRTTFGNVNKQYCRSDVRQLKRIGDV